MVVAAVTDAQVPEQGEKRVTPGMDGAETALESVLAPGHPFDRPSDTRPVALTTLDRSVSRIDCAAGLG